MKDLQEKVKQFTATYNLDTPLEHRALDLISEIGEVAKEILKMSEYGKKPLTYREEFSAEIGDAFFSLLTLANYFDIDGEEALKNALAKYEKRLQKGSAGSESDL